MASRLDLQTLLESMLGSRNVYFQPPESVELKYPCILYKLNKVKTDKADNTLYKKDNSYTVTLIHRDPDNTLKDELLYLPYCSFDRFYTADNLNHYVYTIYY